MQTPFAFMFRFSVAHTSAPVIASGAKQSCLVSVYSRLLRRCTPRNDGEGIGAMTDINNRKTI